MTSSDLPEASGRALEQWCVYLAGQGGRSTHTVRAYRADMRDLLAFAAERGVDSPTGITLTMLRSWLADNTERGCSRATVARRAAAARGFMQWVFDRGMTSSDVGSRLASPKLPRHLPTVLSHTEVDRLLRESAHAADDDDPIGVRDHAVLEVLYGTGIRVSELVGCDLSDVDPDRRTLRVLGKGAKERIVPFGQPAGAALARWSTRARAALVTPKSGSALFLGARGGRLDPRMVRQIVTDACRRAGIDAPIGPHGFRHSAATHVLDGGADLRAVQELLGHASLGSTQIYTHVSVDRLRSAFDQAHPRA